MIAFTATAIVVVVDFAWVTSRARREWADGSELNPSTGLAISSLYVLAVALVAEALIVRPWPLGITSAVAILVGGLLVVLGIAIALLGARPFGSLPRLYGVETGGLIEGGVYRFSRNPQYAGLIVLAVGIAVAGRSLLTLLVAALIAVALWIWVVAAEEPHLTRAFGERYERYLRAAPRFLGLPRTDLR